MEIYDPPAVLYFRGELEELKGAAVAVVGSRKATAYGRNAAIKISRDLAAAGVAVISGMARGIDTCAHLGAHEGGGRTYAVLGCGLDICYPPENKSSWLEIEGTEPLSANSRRAPGRTTLIFPCATGLSAVFPRRC